MLPDLGPGHDAWLREFMPSLLSTLLVVPDNPEEGVLFLIKAALNTVNKYEWDRGLGLRSLTIMDGVRLLCAASRESYPYSYQVSRSGYQVTSSQLPAQGGAGNDVLYGHDEALVAELERMAATLVSLVKADVEMLEADNSKITAGKIKAQLVTTLGTLT